MPYYQRMQVMGVTGEAAELKFTEDGRPRAHFSVFVEEAWRDTNSGERKSLTTIFRCVAFNKLGEQAAKVLKKGTWVFVEGRMRSRKVKDREHWSINCDRFQRLEKYEAEDEDQSHDTEGE